MAAPGPARAALGALLLLSLSGPPSLAAHGEQQLEPGRIFEVTVNLTAGQAAGWTLRVQPPGEPAVYNIHDHLPNGSSTNYAQGVLNGTLAGNFTAPSANAYSWLLTNVLSEQTLLVDIDVAPQAAKAAPAAPGSMPLAALALAALAALAAGARRQTR